jgi:hypothetical protein
MVLVCINSSSKRRRTTPVIYIYIYIYTLSPLSLAPSSLSSYSRDLLLHILILVLFIFFPTLLLFLFLSLSLPHHQFSVTRRCIHFPRKRHAISNRPQDNFHGGPDRGLHDVSPKAVPRRVGNGHVPMFATVTSCRHGSHQARYFYWFRPRSKWITTTTTTTCSSSCTRRSC